jgi:alkylhydroperoxidase family enzyme
MRLNKARISPLEEENWNEQQKQLLAPQAMRGKIQNIFLTLANHEKLAKRWMVFANHILYKSSLQPRHREILILRIGWLCQAGYEWGQHVLIGKASGLTDSDISAIKEGHHASNWDEIEALLIKATDELHQDAFISDETWNGLEKSYSQEQLMDLVFTVGQYNLVSMALNSFGVQAEDDLPGF